MYIDKHLWSFTEGIRARIGATVVVGLLAACVGVARLALLGWVLAKVFAGDPLSELLWPFICVGLVMGLRGALEYWRNMMAHQTAVKVQLSLRQRLYDKIVELGPAYFGLERTGDALLSVVEGVERLEVYFGQYLPQLFVCAFVPLVVFAFVAFLDLPVALVMVGFALLALFAPAVFHSWDSANATGRQKAYADFSAEFLDSLQGLATLQAFGQSKARGELLAEKAYELFRRTMWVLATNSLSRGITDTCIAVGAAAMLGLGAFRVIDGAMTMTALLMILMMGVEVFRPLRDLRALLHEGMLGTAAAKGIVDLLGKSGLLDKLSVEAEKSAPLEPTVEFDQVTFTYPGGRRRAHKDLSFQVRAGERIGVVGSSGCGKSSIVRLLLRLYDPQEGSVRLGGKDVRKLSDDEIYRQIAVVNQDTYLFHGTVEENLRFGKPDASDEALAAAARTANAHEFIMRLPQGYDTVVGERGIKLSGGQRQRIAIARAVLRDAPILVLDEALSAVDTENEAIIQEALERIMLGRTTLIFAHRLSSVIDADRLLVLDDGELVESGTHARLMGAGGTYFSLMSGQIERATGETLTRDERVNDETMDALDETWRTAYLEPTDGILRAEGLGWLDVLRELMAMVVPWRARLIVTFALGVARGLCVYRCRGLERTESSPRSRTSSRLPIC